MVIFASHTCRTDDDTLLSEEQIIERRGFAHLKDKPDVKSLYHYQELFKISEEQITRLFEFIPFINGGLFECLDKNKTSDGVEQAYYDDGFSRNSTIRDGHWTRRAFVPNKLFFDPEDGIVSIFNRYDFTVEENSPSEQQVALDPELLGKVFENLLGAYNPETEQTARNQSGSFYTPREIVNYMVDISLQQYLGDTDEVKALFADDFEYDESMRAFHSGVIEKLKAKTLKSEDVYELPTGSVSFAHRYQDKYAYRSPRIFIFVSDDGKTAKVFDEVKLVRINIESIIVESL